MEIQGPGHIHGPQPIRAPHRLNPTESNPQVGDLQQTDQVDISPEADLVSRVGELPDIRTDRVEDIRAQIEAGTYETDDKLEIALGRLLDELG